MQQIDIASLIFPPMQPLPQVLNTPRRKEDVLQQIKSDPDTFSRFQNLTQDMQEAFVGFCAGNRGLKITYDPFFKHIFDTDRHPERLSQFLSCLLKQPIQIKEVLPTERRRISENSSLLIMDILVQLADGRIVDVEMQRIGFDFPIERGFCYASDLLIRQYDKIHAVKKEQQQDFSYRDIKPVYVIVLMEKSSEPFLKDQKHYLHRSAFSFRTGLKIESLQNFIYVSLDIFRKMKHNKLTELDAWLYFLCSDSPKDILRIIGKYPFFQELYQDIVNFRFQPKELISMFSEALYIMDRNTVRLMIEELKEDNAKKDLELFKKDSELSKKDLELSKLAAENALLQAQLKRLESSST